jgi:NAD(P)-dependent dehydrogenase (short-subunit alcohol dehydrogenase family)
MGDMLQGRVAVVTGAGTGLGRAHAIGMAAQGARVVVNDIGTSWDGVGTDDIPGDEVVDIIRRSGGIAVASHDSVAAEESARRIIQTAIDNFGRIDILVNNAGIIRNQPIYEVPPGDWDAVIRTHLYGTFFCTRFATPHMKEQGYGRIINTSSHIGLGFRGQSTYSAAKEGITGFSRSIARDMGRFGVTCNVIRPIAAWRGIPDNMKNERIESLRPEDVAAFVVYLASESAGNINGCIFEVFRGHIGIFVEPPPVAQVLWKDGSLTPEELVKTMPRTLTGDKEREKFPRTFPFGFDLRED